MSHRSVFVSYEQPANAAAYEARGEYDRVAYHHSDAYDNAIERVNTPVVDRMIADANNVRDQVKKGIAAEMLRCRFCVLNN